MTKHTPGPWVVIPSTPQDGVNCWWVHSATGVDIAIVNGPQNPETEADARLIAAAPELLEALQHILRCIPIGGLAQIHHNSSTWEQIDAAITKALGESE